MTKEEIQNKIAKLKSNLSNPKLSEYYDDFNKGIAKLENDLAMVGETAVKDVKKVGTTAVKDVKKVEKKVSKAVTSVRKPRTTKASASNDIEKAKAEIKAKTGKTESECEDIIEKYRALRTKSQERRKKEVSANESNTKRIVKLKKQGDIIEGTNIKTADATIESAKVDVVDKIEKQIEVAEEKAEVEATKEVAKDKTLTPTEKKKAVAEKVEKVVKEKTKVIVKRVIIDTTAFLTSISEKLGEFDKDSQKEFLIKLRSDIDKLLSKYSYGGMTSGATQGYNITQSNMSSSSVNSFANGGGVFDWKKQVTSIIGTKAEAEKSKKSLQDYWGKSGRNFQIEKIGDDEGDSYRITYEFTLTDKMANGGGVGVNGYANKSVEQIWNEWTPKQKRHFLSDHKDEFVKQNSLVPYSINELSYKTFDTLKINYPIVYKSLQKHIQEGEYAKGGGVDSISYDKVLMVLKDKLENAVDELPTQFENSSNYKGEEVESQSRDGFIAYTDGGYEVTWFDYLSYFYSSGYSLPTSALDKEKDRQIEYQMNYAKERFMDEYPQIVEELGAENIDYNSLNDAGYGDEAEELSQYESEFDDDSIMGEIGAYYYSPENDRGIDGKHTLRLFGLVNLESPYHRSGNLEDRYDIDITFNSISDLEKKVQKGLAEIIKWFDGANYKESTKELKIVRMAKGGAVEDTKKIIESIKEIRYDRLPPMEKRTMSISAYQKILLEATKYAIKELYRNDYYDIENIQKATIEAGGIYNKAFVDLYGKKLTYKNGGGVDKMMRSRRGM